MSLLFFYEDSLRLKTIIGKAFVSGKDRLLFQMRYLRSPLIDPIRRRILVLFLKATRDLVPLRFWILVLHHFMFFYTIVVTVRFVLDFAPATNLAKSGAAGQVIFNLSEPYFKVAESILPRGLLLLTFLLFDYFEKLIGLIYRVLVLYGRGSKKKLWIEAIDTLALSLYGESFFSYS